MPAAVGPLRRRLPELTLRDERRLRRRLDRARRLDDPAARDRALRRAEDEIAAAEARMARRRAAVPAVRYPPELPISARVDDLAAAIAEHQVVVVAGETGSGKTTQLPKLCLDLGRGVRGGIAHTQPRRIAARTVAERIADELEVPLGGAVGYQVRFDQRTSDDTLLTVMTDGILLNAVQHDPALRSYDTIIIDEAHERSLNIDFLIGYLTRLLPRRPDLEVVVTSATIDPHRFARHFDDAPVIEVSGRTYPVEIRYRPLDPTGIDGDGPPDEDADDDPAVTGARDQLEAIGDAVDELCAEGPGDILVFLSGEREIRDTADGLADRVPPDTEVLPLYGRLAASQQRRVFQPHAGRRIVLATNVAETSVTVPGIHSVVDAGYARISRYSTRRKVQRLPIEKVSQASADQRAGRCGRTADGICIRLYSRADYDARPRFTDPEIQRTNLASVLLQMSAAGLGDIADFPFLDPPDPRQVRDGVALLHELGAVQAGPAASGRRARSAPSTPSLTPVGRTLARLPIDPRLGRMIVEADRNACLDEVLVIVAALSIPDPRQRPTDAREAADALHARFADDASDFVTWLNLWRYVTDQRRDLSGNRFRALCRAEHLHHLRVREWQDLHAQLWRLARELGMRRTGTPAQPDAVHRSVLAGLLSHIGHRDGDDRDYRGARGARFAIQPGSVLFRQRPRWIMAAELVETSRLWGRTVARVRPEWAEQLGGHLVTRSYAEPRWDARRGRVVADETVRLYGVPLVSGRTVDYGRVDPAAARAVFIERALVAGEWEPVHEFWHANRRRMAAAATLEDKLRRRDVVVDDDALFDFYDARVGATVTSTRAFDAWWADARRDAPQLLDLTVEALIGDVDAAARAAAFPDVWRQGDLALPLTYRFDPGAADDGVTVHVPVTTLHALRPDHFDWQVPGLRRALVVALLRTLPKDVRRRLVPVPDTADAVLSTVAPTDGSLLDALGRALRDATGVTVDAADWRLDAVPSHLRPHFAVTDRDGGRLAEGDDLAALQRALAPQARAALTRSAGIERRGLRRWEIGSVPTEVTVERDGQPVRGFPALVDTGDSVAVQVLPTPARQRAAMWAGTRRLLRLDAGTPVAAVHRRLDNATKLALTTGPHDDVAALIDDALTATLDELLLRHGGPVWDADAFDRLARAVRADLLDELTDVLVTVAGILRSAAGVRGGLDDLDGVPGLDATVTDLRTQLAGLVHPGFVTAKSVRRLDDVTRYLTAMQRRVATAPRDPARDRRRMDRVGEVLAAYRELVAELSAERRAQPAVREIPWMLEELRVSEFAQELGTARRVSPERVLRAIGDAAAA